jgi:hypothetical protein
MKADDMALVKVTPRKEPVVVVVKDAPTYVVVVGPALESPRGPEAAAAYAEMSRGRQTKGGVIDVDA